jgi:hypothetical protein
MTEVSGFRKIITEEFDSKFDTSEGSNLNWLPMVGKHYCQIPDDKKILILGESAPNWPGNKTILENNPEHVRDKVVYDYLQEKTGLIGNYLKTITGKDKFSQDARIKFWRDMAFHELVTTAMKKEQRPTDEEYRIGWEVFWSVYNILKPSICIMSGTHDIKVNTFASVAKRKFGFTESKKDLTLRSHKVGRYCARTMKFEVDGKTVRFFFIRHPSAFYSWRQWRNFLESEIPDVMAYYNTKEY